MNYRSVNDLNRCIVDNLHRVPRNIDLVVGIPRSGLLAANLLALHFNLPLADLEGFLVGRVIGAGPRGAASAHRVSERAPRTVLVVDDSIYSGSQMAKARDLIKKSGFSGKAIYAAVYATPEAFDKVDIAFEVCPLPRVFEWNVMHHSILKSACLDIDGVLCRDPRKDENDDGPRYRSFIENIEPFLVPTFPVAALVSCRLERYRDSTENWLKKNGIRYGELVMMHYPTKVARVAAGRHAAFKADVYLRTAAQLFIESDRAQAVAIANLSRRAVFCVETREMILPSTQSIVSAIPGKAVRALKRRIVSFTESVKNQLIFWLRW